MSHSYVNNIMHCTFRKIDFLSSIQNWNRGSGLTSVASQEKTASRRSQLAGPMITCTR